MTKVVSDGITYEIAAHGLAGLRQMLTGEGTCGTWVPARPGDVDGPTIAEIVAAGG
jgi:hypothetical protein